MNRKEQVESIFYPDYTLHRIYDIGDEDLFKNFHAEWVHEQELEEWAAKDNPQFVSPGVPPLVRDLAQYSFFTREFRFFLRDYFLAALDRYALFGEKAADAIVWVRFDLREVERRLYPALSGDGLSFSALPCPNAKDLTAFREALLQFYRERLESVSGKFPDSLICAEVSDLNLSLKARLMLAKFHGESNQREADALGSVLCMNEQFLALDKLGYLDCSCPLQGGKTMDSVAVYSGNEAGKAYLEYFRIHQDRRLDEAELEELENRYAMQDLEDWGAFTDEGIEMRDRNGYDFFETEFGIPRRKKTYPKESVFELRSLPTSSGLNSGAPDASNFPEIAPF